MMAPSPESDLYLWAIGILCSLIGALMLIILKRVLDQGDDTNSKVTAQSSTLARVEQSVANLDGRVNDLHAWKNEQMKKEAQVAAAEIMELRKQLRDGAA